jgi:hypothetical protein
MRINAMRIKIATLTLLLLLTACVSEDEHSAVVSRNKQLASQLEELKAKSSTQAGEIAALKAELDEIKFGAARLLEKAKAAHDKQNFMMSSDIAESLLKKHPEAREAILAKQLIKQNTKAIATRKDAQQKRIANALKGLKKDYDEVEEIYWYKPKSAGGYRTAAWLYIGQNKSGGKPWLRFRVRYHDDSWIFVRSYTFKTDKTTHDFTPKTDITRTNSSGSIWEIMDESYNDEVKWIVEDIIKSQKTIIRFNGRDHINDFVVPSSMKQDMQKVLDAFMDLEKTA